MKRIFCLFWLSLTCLAYSETRYVVGSNSNAVAPYTNWATAAATIQDAVDAAAANDTILVTNGVYDTGGRLAGGQVLTNRVAIDMPLVVCSVNGPEVTIIEGAGPYGDAAIRCVYLGTNAALIGFTLTNGHTRTSSGVWPPLPDDCGGGVFCETSAVASNCVLTGNSAFCGGGASYGKLYNCTLTGNSAEVGNGGYGGGAYHGTLYNCTLTGNLAEAGGGAADSTLYNCVLTGNSARYGGGAWGGTLYNCTLTGNSAYYHGGGANGSMLYNCTLTGNSADFYGGGAIGGTLYNCIVYYNTASNGPNFSDCTLNNCCTTPDPGGAGNITAEPQFVNTNGDYHLASGSPCIDAGNNADAAGSTDLDGRSRIIGSAVDMGCYEAPQIYVGESPLHYVSLSGGNVWPYTNWATAATIMQHAVDAANVGDTVLATNGVYDTGGRLAGGQVLTNRVAIDMPLVVRSVNGPEVTIIEGAGPYGDAAIRCVYLGTNAALIGFTLTNGHTRTSSGVWPPLPDDCGGGVFCETSAVASNCVLIGNSAFCGGGASYGKLYNCTLTGNSAEVGNGGYGGGAYHGTLYNCTLTGNLAEAGGGAADSTLYNCVLTGNSARYGGGAWGGTLYNCTLTGNSAYYHGGGANGSMLYNCTLTGNSADSYGGGAIGGTLYNCIVYYNTASNGPNFSDCTLNYCCTTPDPGGAGNITAEPQFVNTNGDYHLASGSPCIDAGNNADAAGSTDLDGRSRIIGSAVDMGCYEAPQIYVGESPLHYVSLSGGNVWPYMNWATAATIMQHAVDAANVGDTVLATNGVYDTGGRLAGGQVLTNRVAIDMPLVVRSVNGPEVTIIEGAGPYGDAAIRCVYLGTNAALIGFTLTNGHTRGWHGHYSDSEGAGIFCESSAVLSNCVLTGNSASYNGGGAYGGTLYNCTLIGNGGWGGGGASYSTLYNCTLMGNSDYGDESGGGGGAYSCTLSNCTLTGNSARLGGGAFFGTLYNCTLIGNSAALGGGAYGGTLYNCMLTGNSAYGYHGAGGGGAFGGTLYNCIVYYNTASNDPNFSGGTLMNYCCTMPLPDGGAGNITNAPMFAYLAGGNLRLLSNSPCVNAGTNQDWMVDAVDLDGRPRIIGGVVDMGAYERGSILPIDWLQKYGLNPDGESDFLDSDEDGMNNWQEWRCKTDPTNETSFLGFMTLTSEGEGFVLRWRSEEGVRYRLDRSTNLCTDVFGYLVRTNILATPSINSETDTVVGSGPWFYRVGVE